MTRHGEEVHPGATGAFDRVHVRLVRAFPELVSELGGDAARLLGQVGIDAAALDSDGPLASYRQTVELLELAARQLACPEFGMRLAARQGGSVAGPLGQAMRHSPRFGDALDYVARHTFAHSLAARIWLKPLPRGDAIEGVFAGHDILLDRLPNRSQAMELILLSGHLSAIELTGGHARVRRVNFRHQPLSPMTTYRRYFGCEVRFGEHDDGVVYSAGDLACPVIDPDVRTYHQATAFIDAQFALQRQPLPALARGLVMQFLGSEHCTNERIAGELNLHPRTLHRRLRDEGTSFQRIKDEVRRDVMLYYIEQTDLDFARVSEKLGFAEQSVMTRSCNRWLAASPTHLRARARSASA